MFRKIKRVKVSHMVQKNLNLRLNTKVFKLFLSFEALLLLTYVATPSGMPPKAACVICLDHIFWYCSFCNSGIAIQYQVPVVVLQYKTSSLVHPWYFANNSMSHKITFCHPAHSLLIYDLIIVRPLWFCLIIVMVDITQIIILHRIIGFPVFLY